MIFNGKVYDNLHGDCYQGQEFEKEICPCTKILYFEVSDDTMTERLLNRGKSSGRVDDNVETIKKRLDTFHKHSKPVMDAYKDKCCTVSLGIFAIFLRSIESICIYFRFRPSDPSMTFLLMSARPWTPFKNIRIVGTMVVVCFEGNITEKLII